MADRKMQAEPIAIVGLGGIFPDAANATEFWKNIEANHVAIREVPKHRWDPELFWSADRSEPDKTYSRIGGFLRDEHMKFDARRFRIPPKTLRSIDTVQQLAVSAVADALLDAGYQPLPGAEEGRELDRDRTAVILGNAMGGTYEKQTVARSYFPEVARALHESPAFKSLPNDTKAAVLAEAESRYKERFPPITEDTMPGELSNCVAGRIANALDLRGTNYTTDAACAASMAALKSAMDGLRLHQFDVAVAGGADQMVDPSAYIKFSKIGALSPDHSVPFDARANGFVMGEGVGILVLKRLCDAERDGDRIYAVVRGIGAASDGKGKGMTAPNPRGQRMAVQRAYEDAGFGIDTVGLFEAHGTSTVVGDATEVGVLTELLKAAGTEPARVPLGSVKSMIGHLKAAAGAASLIKIALSLHHKRLPPSAGFEHAPASSPLNEGYLAVNTEARPWQSEGPRRAGVSAFGFGGTNAHAVLEEYRGPHAIASGDENDRRIKSTPAKAGKVAAAASAVTPVSSENEMTTAPDALLNAVIQIFAEATGYDEADLEPDYDLEADLGIDTVKQAEVLGTLRERYGISSDDELKLSDVSTLRAVARYLAAQLGSSKEAFAASPVTVAAPAVAGVTGESPSFDGWEVLCFGGDDARAAGEKARSQLDGETWPPPQALLAGRAQAPEANARLAFAANDAASALKKAQSAGKRNARVLNAQGIFATEGQSLASKGSVAFLFPGQGSQFLGMYRDLAGLFPVVRKTFEEADRVLEPLIGSKLTAYTWADASTDEERSAAELRLRQTEICQPAMLTADVAMFRLLGTFGLRPSMVVGHSLGEYAACVASGVMTFAEALYAVSARGREMAHVKVEDNGKMASVAAGADKVEPMLADIDGYIIAANKNCHAQTVIAGNSRAVEQAVEKFTAAGIDAREIPVSHAFHSAIVAPASVPLKNALKTLDIKAPQIPILSNVHAGFYPAGKDAIIDLLGKQLESPVEFIRQIESMYERGARVFVECGPRRAATGFVRNVLGNEREYQAVATNHHKRPAIQPLMDALAMLASEGVEIDFSASQPDPLVASAPRSFSAASQPAGAESSAVLPEERRQAPLEGREMRANPVITGVSFLPPAEKVLDDDYAMGTLDRMLNGENLIRPLSESMRQEMVDKNVVRLEKSSGDFTRLQELSDVIQLAASFGELDIVETYGIDGTFDDALDRSSRMAIAAGIEALRDAGIPMVRHYRTTSTGKRLPERWGLPDALSRRTGVLVGTAFPSTDRVIEDVSQHVASKYAGRTKRQLSSLVEEMTRALKDPAEREAIRAQAEPMLSELQREAELYQFSRKFLFRSLAMAHAQLAQVLAARGPNSLVNAACASGTLAITTAHDWLTLGRCDRVVVVGADDVTSEPLLPYVGAGFLAAGAATTEREVEKAAIPFGAKRNGLILGSGAAGFVIETEESARARGLEPLAELVHSQSSNSAFHGTRLDTKRIAKDVKDFVDDVMRAEGIGRDELARTTFFMSHETYTPARGGSSQAEVDALRAAFEEHVGEVLIANTKGQHGHPMGANLEDAVAVKALQREVLPPVANLNDLDPEFSGLRFSRGGAHSCRYALHLAAGFGSQLGLAMFKQRATSEARLTDLETYHRWLDEVTEVNGARLEVTNRTLRVAESGGVMANALAVPSLEVQERPASAPVRADVQLSTVDHSRLLVEITELFANESGYEVSDLEPAFELEADLGIDTVKQAEIFTTLREKYGLPRDDEFKLSDVPTLNAVVDYVIGQMGAATESAATDSAMPAPSVEPAPVSAAVERGTLLVEITQLFADESGYEVSDLEPAFELEADLGIDTVKQAEIFTTLREKYGLPRDDEFKLSDVPTLNAVVDYVIGQMGAVQGGASVTAPSTAQTPPAESPATPPTPASGQARTASAAAPALDRSRVLLEITQLFANESGYEVSDFEPAFELEADLGIDTVKQAEIFTTLREKYGLPRDDEFKLSDVPTLNAVVDYVIGQMGAATESAATDSAMPAPSAEPAPVSAAVERGTLLVEITQLFADESGYEVSDLEPTFELEADLGIDTVKQAEIFTTLREKYGLPRDDEFKLSDVPTLNGVVDYVIEQLARTSASAGEAGGEEGLGKSGAARASAWVAENRFRVRATERYELPALGADATYEGRDVALTGGDEAFRQAVREALLARGANVHMLEIDSQRPESVEARLADLGGRQANDLVFLGPDSLDDATRVEQVCRDAFNALRCFARARGGRGAARIALATRTDGLFGALSRDPASWIAGGFAGLAKSLGQEWSDARVVAVDLDRSSPLSVSANTLLDEAAISGPREIAHHAGRRYTLRRALEPERVAAAGLPAGSVIVATGGARGVTFELVRELCRRSALKVVLVGRTAPVSRDQSVLANKSEAEQKEVARAVLTARGERVTPIAIKRFIEREESRIEVQTNMDALVALGSEVQVVSADLTDAESIAALASTVRERFGACDVLLHGAGREESKMLVDKTDESFLGTFAPKSTALLRLHDSLKPKRTVSMGSIAGRFGNAGQTDYAQANELLAAFSRGTPGALCLDWTAWGDVGMATKEGVKKVLETLGVEFLPAAVGATIGADLVASEVTGDVVIAGALGDIAKDEARDDAQGAARQEESAGAGGLPAIFDRMEARGAQTVYVRRLDPARDRGLDHHRLQGTAVLPGVLGVEMMAEAAAAATGQSVVALHDVSFSSPLKLHRDEPLEVQVRVRDGDSSSREVTLVTVFRGPGGKTRERVHFTATVVFGERRPLGIPHARAVHLPRSPSINREAIYERYFHGPVFQVLNAPKTLGEDGVVGETISRWDAWLEGLTHDQFQTAPFLREAGFQVAGLWEMVELGRMALPAGVERIELGPHRVTGGAVRLEARRIGWGADGCTFDVWSLDENGEVLDVMRGYRTVVLRHLAEEERFDPARGSLPAPDWLWVDVSEIEAKLDKDPSGTLEHFLSPGERVRFQELKTRKRQLEWLAGRIAAKRLIREVHFSGEGAVVSYPAIEVQSNTLGAPVITIVGESGEAPRVSISHSDGVAAAMLAGDSTTAPGIDVEAVERRSDAFVRDYFTERERMSIDAAGALRDQQVTAIWAVKEAMMKALGIGARVDFRQIEVTLGDGAQSTDASVECKAGALERARELGAGPARAIVEYEGRRVVARVLLPIRDPADAAQSKEVPL